MAKGTAAVIARRNSRLLMEMGVPRRGVAQASPGTIPDVRVTAATPRPRIAQEEVSTVGLSDDERRVVDEVEARRGELLGLATELIGYDTTARGVDDPPRQERELQGALAERLGAAGPRVRAMVL